MVMAWAGQICLHAQLAFPNPCKCAFKSWDVYWRGPYGLAELAGNASLFTGWVSSQRVFATESGRNGALRKVLIAAQWQEEALHGYLAHPRAQPAYLFEWVVNGVAVSLQSVILFTPVTSENPESPELVYNIRWSEELLQQDVHSSGHLGHEEVLAQPVQQAVLFPHPLDLLARSEVLRRGSLGSRISPLLLVVGSGQHPRRHHERAGRGRSSGKLAFGEHGCCCRGGECRRHCSSGFAAIDGVAKSRARLGRDVDWAGGDF